MAVTIVLTNQKGGVGKTSSTNAVVAGLIKKGKKVLSIDLDPQGNLGFSFGINIDKGKSIYNALTENIGLEKVIRKTNNYGDVITSNILLSNVEHIFTGEKKQLRLKNLLEPIKNEYDYIIIDTPPALNLLTINGYVAADYLIIPMAAEILSLVGLVQLRDTVEGIKKSYNSRLRVLGILLTRFEAKRALSQDVKEMAEMVASQIGTELFQSKIRNNISVAEAPAHGLSILDYAPRCNSSKDYRDLVDEIMQKI